MKAILAGIIATQVCTGETAWWPTEKAAIDEARSAAISGTRRVQALEILEAVAEGRPIDTIVATAAHAGFTRFNDRLSLDSEDVRLYAISELASTDLPEVIEYLSAITPERIRHDDSHSLFPAAKIALETAILRKESDPNRQTSLLEGQLREPVVPAAALWASDELCNRGSAGSVPLIQQIIRRFYSGKRAEDTIAFCSARIEVLNRDPDRARALGTILNIDAKSDQEQMMRWAVKELLAVDTPESRATLQNYASEVYRVFPDIPSQRSSLDSDMHRGLAQLIRRRYPEERPK